MPAASRLDTVAAAPDQAVRDLVTWLKTATAVLHSATTSADFFARAAAALVDLVGLDAGRVLLLTEGQWRVEAAKVQPNRAGDPWQPSQTVLDQLRTEKRTVWYGTTALAQSLKDVTGLVAAAIMDPQGAVIGALYGDRVGQPGPRPIGTLEASLVELLASGVASGLARLEREKAALSDQRKLLQIEDDIKIGTLAQSEFLPALPGVAGWELATHFRAARKMSGDFYDVFVLPHGHVAVVIADVCDKGIGAALYMVLYRSLLRAFAEQTLGRGLLMWSGQSAMTADAASARRRCALVADFTALATIELANSYVAQTHGQHFMFATVFFGVLDVQTGALTYVNAGHPDPLLLSTDRIKCRLPPTGPGLGVCPLAAYDIQRRLLEPGDTLLAYTDGVTEARALSGEFFTEQRLLAAADPAAPSAQVLLQRVADEIRQHVNGAEPSDDVAMLAIRRAL